MKSNLSILGALTAIVCAAVFAAGCMTFDEETSSSEQLNHQNWGAFGEVIVPVKDFTSVGLVFTEVQLQTNADNTIDGAAFTYQALLKEAHKAGADGIVNVVIDRTVKTATTVKGYSTAHTRQETWYGSALAIKYAGALVQANITSGPITVSPTRQYSFNAASSSGQPAASEQPAPAGQPAAPAQTSVMRTGFR